ncbi:MAG: cytochrome b/b6 domain-containing protein [Reyranellaceae bacterium]
MPVKVWDLFVRTFHWSLATLFVIAYVSEGEPLWLHSWAGYLIAVLVLLRVVWGFVGPRHARFADFIAGPVRVLRYLVGLATGTARRYLGHSPAGGAMVIALLLSLLATTGTGMALHAVRNGAGPLAFAIPAQTAIVTGDQRLREDGRARKPRKPGHDIEEIHELFANLTLVLVFLHLGGVLAASLAHRENLVRAMLDGRKRPLSD